MKDFDFTNIEKSSYRLIKTLIYYVPIKHRPPEMTINDIVIDAMLYRKENDISFDEAIKKVFSRMVLSYRRQNPILYKYCNDIAKKWMRENPHRLAKIQSKYNKKSCENLTDAYIIRLLKQRKDKSDLINNTNIIEETRQRLILKRAAYK